MILLNAAALKTFNLIDRKMFKIANWPLLVKRGRKIQKAANFTACTQIHFRPGPSPETFCLNSD